MATVESLVSEQFIFNSGEFTRVTKEIAKIKRAKLRKKLQTRRSIEARRDRLSIEKEYSFDAL